MDAWLLKAWVLVLSSGVGIGELSSVLDCARLLLLLGISLFRPDSGKQIQSLHLLIPRLNKKSPRSSDAGIKTKKLQPRRSSPMLKTLIARLMVRGCVGFRVTV